MRHGKVNGWIFILVLLALFGPAIFGHPFWGDPPAQEKADVEDLDKTLKTAVERFKNGDHGGALRILSDAVMLIRNAQDFQLAKMLLCTEVRDYRDFDAKEGFELMAGEPFLLYLEPEGFQMTKDGDAYRIWVSQDASISNDKGEVIFQRNDWVDYKRDFPIPIVPFYLTNRVRDIPPGEYSYTLTLKDHYKNTFYTKTFKFTVK